MDSAVHTLNKWGEWESGLNTRDARDSEKTWHAGVTKNYKLLACRVSSESCATCLLDITRILLPERSPVPKHCYSICGVAMTLKGLCKQSSREVSALPCWWGLTRPQQPSVVVWYWGVWEMTTTSTTTTPQINDLVCRTRKINRAARAARFLVQFSDVVCQTTREIFWGSDDNARPPQFVYL